MPSSIFFAIQTAVATGAFPGLRGVTELVLSGAELSVGKTKHVVVITGGHETSAAKIAL